MAIFSNNNAVVITGLKHGSTQLQHSAAKHLGIPYSDDHSNPFVRWFDYAQITSLTQLKQYGPELLRELNFPLTNTYFNKINFVYDLHDYKNKPVILIIRDPLKAAQASIIEDLYILLNDSSGYLSGSKEIYRNFFNFHGPGTLSKDKLAECTFIEDLFFHLNEDSLYLENKKPKTILQHTSYLHLHYISGILNFFSTSINSNFINNSFIVNLDSSHDEETKNILHNNGILTKPSKPVEFTHSTKKLKSVLPTFLNEISNVNVMYKRRLLIESAIYSFIYETYKDSIFNLEKYKTSNDTYTEYINTIP
jgi:hypothetical protein